MGFGRVHKRNCFSSFSWPSAAIAAAAGPTSEARLAARFGVLLLKLLSFTLRRAKSILGNCDYVVHIERCHKCWCRRVTQTRDSKLGLDLINGCMTTKMCFFPQLGLNQYTTESTREAARYNGSARQRMSDWPDNTFHDSLSHWLRSVECACLLPYLFPWSENVRNKR